MNLAEKKLQLLQMVMDADEETTGKLIELASRLQHSTERYTEEELLKFHTSRQQYHDNPATGTPLAEAHAYIRTLKNR